MEQDFQTLIRRADEADRAAADTLFAILYQELHQLAEHHLRRGGPSLTLGTTTLLHEAYLNIAKRPGFAGRTNTWKEEVRSGARGEVSRPRSVIYPASRIRGRGALQRRVYARTSLL